MKTHILLGGGGVKRNIFHDIFSSLVTLDNIFIAYYEFRKDKRNRKDVLEFEINLEENLYDLYQDLVSGEYKHGLYKIFLVSDPKPRKIAKATVRDRVVHHLVAKKLEEIYEPCFIYDLYSSRKEKGVLRAVMRLQGWLHSCGGLSVTVIKCDIRRFFASVDHGILVRILGKKIEDEKLMGLLKTIILSFPKGIPLGNLTSQLFANIYLNEFDQFIKHRLKIRYYIRYCDDFIITNHANSGELLRISRFLKDKLKLDLHPNKIAIRKPSQGIDFLGCVVFPRYLKLRNKTKKRMMRKISKKEGNSLETTISYFSLLKHCKSFKIRLDICKIICQINQNEK